MTDTLVSNPVPAQAGMSSMIVTVAKEHGVSPIKQFIEIAKLRFGASKLASNEYYAGQMYRSDLSATQKKQFVGETRNKQLNLSMSPREIARISDFLQDKVLYAALLAQLGLRAATAQAVFSTVRGFGSMTTLQDAAQIEDFLLNKAKYPVFGKPVEGSKSIGSARFTSVDKAKGTLKLGDGRVVEVAATAKEIFENYPRGYVFQDAVTQHKDMTAVAGPALGTLRVVTVMEDAGPRVLYALWKIPSPDAMSDNFWQDGSMLAELDAEKGQVKQVRRGTGMKTEVLESHPVSGKAFAGFQIPNWDAVQQAVLAAHKLAPGNGILGFDIGMAQDGPIIIECNTNPFHSLYQLATGRGILNEDFAPVFETIANGKAAILAAYKKMKK